MKPSAASKLAKIFEAKVPENAAPYCLKLWKEAPFHFTVSKSRLSKLGDFRFRADQSVQTITINHNLNRYQFLITYIHEVAHHRAFRKYGTTIKPHGNEWKNTFKQLMQPVLTDEVFPKDLLIPLRRHMTSPKASSSTDFWLNRELRKYDASLNGLKATYLYEVTIGTVFELRGRKFKKVQPRRTRVLCEEVTSGRHYLISGNAEISLSLQSEN
ncbi:transcription elongation protein SprT [Echinicola strongylocentroti]|uniref:Transcription elongation protein SprT n=1 Tax=Echinicola strongylocentroti TaxID=1795355 RepID=A0A2Z4IJH1_9BACT|nr:SprT-like domain-containing protein [Echinicola strongylocentroti]AWW30676.1 transcription elongation protein SprT [Echinicola strongylocentroti]